MDILIPRIDTVLTDSCIEKTVSSNRTGNKREFMRRIRLVVAYDGTDYCGWQIQPNGITIEEVLNTTLKKLTGEDIHVIGASRTDSGVHALGNVAVFDTDSPIPPERMAYALNRKLPEDIVIVKSDEVPPNWHPRYQDRVSKTYEYHIYNAPVPDPMKRRYSTFVSFPMDADKMREGAAYLTGEHDFVSFCNIRTNVENTVRTIDEIVIENSGSDITIRVTGNGFLYNMVRIIAGTLIRVGRGFYTPGKVKEILEAKQRTEAGVTAPPEGLTLLRISYEEEGNDVLRSNER
jgi:tRNA pseudouridine38-40 synthase